MIVIMRREFSTIIRAIHDASSTNFTQFFDISKICNDHTNHNTSTKTKNRSNSDEESLHIDDIDVESWIDYDERFSAIMTTLNAELAD